MPSPELTQVECLGNDFHAIQADFRRHFNHTLGRDRDCRSAHYAYYALALTVRDRIMNRWRETRYAYAAEQPRQLYYLSMEFLMGRALGNALLNLDLESSAQEALRLLSVRLEELADEERDAGLGNGGLGRLAACFLDSCATLSLPVTGYGLRYEYGMFRQRVKNGYQVEEPDHWLREGNPWELERPEFTKRVKFGGRTEHHYADDGRLRVRWVDTHDVLAVPFDVPIPGYRNGTVNTLRLWKAAATDAFDLHEFNDGSYPESVARKNEAEHITMVLYPNDASENGKELRLKQQYFLASASLQDVFDAWKGERHPDFSSFPDKHCFQLNDTHPSCTVPELMRILLDDYGLTWREAWDITHRSVAYTNHTLLPEALECWPVSLFRRLLPRILEIIYEINARFMTHVSQRWPGDTQRMARMSIIEEGAQPAVRMAHLAVVASFSVNGVAELHSDLLKRTLFRDFSDFWPKRFNNKTNGVTPRRWLTYCNPGLSRLISDKIGTHWQMDLMRLADLSPFARDEHFGHEWREVRVANQRRLSDLVFRSCGVEFQPRALFDVQVKRIHEYKRQLLNILHVIHLYDRIKRGDSQGLNARNILIGGKAAPGYAMAKSIIKLANNVAQNVNTDKDVNDLLRVAFVPDYNVTAMEVICPGADLSVQISTAGKEASGTGNMKLMMNGAVTIGTLDGANVEILDAVGPDSFFLFGLNADQVAEHPKPHDPNAVIESDPDLSRVMHLLESGHFNHHEPAIFQPITDSIRSPDDPWMTAVDFADFARAQRDVEQAFRDEARWTAMSIANTAASGRFSSDRTIRDYNDEIWKLEALNARS